LTKVKFLNFQEAAITLSPELLPKEDQMTEPTKKLTSIFNIALTDRDSEENGKWFDDIIEEGSGIRMKLRRMTAKVVSKTMTRKLTENRKFMVKGKYPAEIDERMLVETLAEAVIVDWEGISTDGENQLPYTVENAETLLTKLPDLRRQVQIIANSLAAFRAEEKEAVLGN
jgi:hypothetical protein